ncbi:H/ACA ribonucleo protein complex, subunit Gar1/Naf1, partial [Ostreococcus tauri]
TETGELLHECEGELVLSLTNVKIPYFNAPIFLENKTAIGRVEEIFGSINSVKFTVKLSDNVLATAYKKGDKFYISPDKLLPLERFTRPAQPRYEQSIQVKTYASLTGLIQG